MQLNPKIYLTLREDFIEKQLKLSVPLFHQSLDICLRDILFLLKSIKVCFSSFTAQDVLSIMGRQQREVEPKRKMKMAKLTGDEMTVQRRNKTQNTTSAFCDIDTQDSPRSSQKQPGSISPSRAPREPAGCLELVYQLCQSACHHNYCTFPNNTHCVISRDSRQFYWLPFFLSSYC